MSSEMRFTRPFDLAQDERGGWSCFNKPLPHSNRLKGQREWGYFIFAHLHRERWAGTARTLFQSAHAASVNAAYSGSKDQKKRSGATETNVVVDVVWSVVVPIRRTGVVIVVVPRAAPQDVSGLPDPLLAGS